MNAKSLALILGVHYNTIYKMIRSGEIKAVRKGRELIVENNEVERLKKEFENNDIIEGLLKENESLKAELKRIKSILKDLSK